MEKLVYLIGRPDALSADVFRTLLLDELAPEQLATDVLALALNVADVWPLPDGVHIHDPDGLLGACLSIWVHSLDERGPLEGRISRLSTRHAGYLVSESVPREYANRDWADGQRSPGVSLVAAFAKPAALDDETFYRRWHGSHTPLSLEIHPLTRYVRNSVARALTPGAPPFRAIVEERVAEMADVADPLRFYGSPEGKRRAVEHVRTFSDLEGMQGMLMSEYILRTGPR